jgi:hypothetical protein
VKDKAVIDLIGDNELWELAKSICSVPDDLIQEVALVLMELTRREVATNKRGRLSSVLCGSDDA